MDVKRQHQIVIDVAHDNGRHASTNSQDKAFWVKAGCTRCAQTHDALGLPRLSVQKSARDLVKGDMILQVGGSLGDEITKIVRVPGVLYVYLNGREVPPCSLVFNHGDPVRVVTQVTA